MSKNIKRFGELTLWENIWYPICRLCNDIDWAIRVAVNRRKIWKRIKHQYQAPWDLIDVFDGICFELFCNYYERYIVKQQSEFGSRQYGGETEIEAEQRYDEFEKLYRWWTSILPKKQQMLEDYWSKAFKMWPGDRVWVSVNTRGEHVNVNPDCPDDEKFYTLENHGVEIPKCITEVCYRLEQHIEEEKEKMFAKLISYRNYLWD